MEQCHTDIEMAPLSILINNGQNMEGETWCPLTQILEDLNNIIYDW